MSQDEMLVLAAIAATLVFGTPTGDARVDGVRHQVTGTIEAWTFEVRARGDLTTSVTIPVTIVPAARVVGVAIPGSQRPRAHDPEAASAWFDTLSDRGRRAVMIVDPGDSSGDSSGDAAGASTPRVLAVRLATVRPGEVVRVTISVERGRAASWIDEDPTGVVVDEDHAIVAVAPETSGPVPTVTIGAPSCACDEGPPPIKRYIKRWIPRVRACYERAAQGDPSLAGTADLAFTVTPAGGVTDIMVGGSLDSGRVQECLVDEVATWQFPARDVTARVHYPLQFRLAR